MTDVLSTIYVLPNNNRFDCRAGDLVPLRRADVRVYGEAAIEAMQLAPQENVSEYNTARIYDLTNPGHLRALADYIEKERW